LGECTLRFVIGMVFDLRNGDNHEIGSD